MGGILKEFRSTLKECQVGLLIQYNESIGKRKNALYVQTGKEKYFKEILKEDWGILKEYKSILNECQVGFLVRNDDINW